MNVSATAGYATALSQAQLGQQVATSVMAKTQNIAKQQGAAVVDMLQQAADLQKSTTPSGQQLFAAEPHKGVTLDVIA